MDFIGDVPWGTHFCHFYQNRADLLGAVLPFFKAGLEAREFCLWVVAEPLTVKDAKNELSRVVPDLESHLAQGGLEIHEGREWYLGAGRVDFRKLIREWDKKLAQALHRGFPGMRANGSTSWLEKKYWKDFAAYEEEVNEWASDKRVLVACSYPLGESGAAEVLDLARTHNFALARREGTWEVVETPQFREAKAEIKGRNEELRRRVRERTRELGAANRELRAGNRRQSAVAALGQTAIRSRNLGALLEEASSVIAETLGASLALVGEWLPETGGFHLWAGVGWRQGFVGSTLAPGDPLLGAYLQDAGEAVALSSAGADSPMAVSAAAREHGVRSGAGVAVRGRTRPWGALAVYGQRPRAYGPDELGFLQSVATVLSLAVERDEVEMAQRREKETLQAIFDNIPVMISMYDSSGRLLRVNREWERTLGWTLVEAQGLDVLAAAYPDPEDRKRAEDFIRRAEHRWADFRMTTRSGRVLDTSWARFALSGGARIGFGIDITERKEREAAQRRQKETFQAIFDNIPVMISITDASERLWRVNREWERTLGWSLEEARGVNLLTECYPEPESQEKVLEFFRGVQSRWADFRMRTRGGRGIEASWACFDLSDGSRISLGLDVTERKQAEAALRESEEKFRQLAENINDVFWLAAPGVTEILYVSPAYERVYGRSRESLYRDPRSWLDAIHPGDRERIARAVEEKDQRGGLDETYRVVRADGSIRWIRDQGFPIRDEAGRTYRYAGIAQDITERKQAEEDRALLLERESKARAEAEAALERLRAIQSITDSALARLALDDLLSELLARLRKAMGGDYAFIQLINEKKDSLFIRAVDGVALELVKGVRVPLGEAVGGRIAADGRPRVVDDLSTIDSSRVEGMTPELSALLRGSSLGTPLQVEGRVIGVVSVAAAQPRRFTEEHLQLLQVVADRVAPAIERFRLAEAARRAEELFRAVVEDQREMIVRWKPDGTRTFVNKAYARMFGQSPEEIVGTSFWPLVAEPYRQQELERVRKLTPESPYSTGVHESRLPDGTMRWTEWTDRALFDEQGQLVELQSVGRDITEGKQAEEEIRRYAARLASLSRRLLTAQEEERRRLAVELHDELGQVLTAVKINLATLERQSGEGTAPAQLKDAIASVDQAMERVRDLALDLRPSVLDDLGLPAAVRWYADRLARATGIGAHLAVDAVPHLPPELETACFRVAQEALTNVARHARARNVWVDLHLVGGAIELRIRDDGIGFDAGAARERANGGASMGILGMHERVSLAGGEYEVTNRPEGGTEVRARFPLRAQALLTP